MKVAKDLKVGLTFIGDNTSMLVDPTADSLVACAGYKYKSRWTANENRPQRWQKTYYRQYPRIDSLYKWWNGSISKCCSIFKRDSLYVVGGKLSILSKGKLKPIIDENDSIMPIDNKFVLTTDTLATSNHKYLYTKRILIDRDPIDSIFLDSLQYDIIRALAWVEKAGTNDTRRCHEHLNDGNHYNPLYNNYWDDFINSQGDTCHDNHLPCENTWSGATGTMQMVRSVWKTAFLDSMRVPRGYVAICSWDSLAWNWGINIRNGKYIFLRDNYHEIRKHSNIAKWDSVCVNCSTEDSIPEYPNKEDLSSYIYNQGNKILSTIDENKWDSVMTAETDGAIYVRNVRGSKHVKPWE